MRFVRVEDLYAEFASDDQDVRQAALRKYDKLKVDGLQNAFEALSTIFRETGYDEPRLGLVKLNDERTATALLEALRGDAPSWQYADRIKSIVNQLHTLGTPKLETYSTLLDHANPEQQLMVARLVSEELSKIDLKVLEAARTYVEPLAEIFVNNSSIAPEARVAVIESLACWCLLDRIFSVLSSATNDADETVRVAATKLLEEAGEEPRIATYQVLIDAWLRLRPQIEQAINDNDSSRGLRRRSFDIMVEIMHSGWRGPRCLYEEQYTHESLDLPDSGPARMVGETRRRTPGFEWSYGTPLEHETRYAKPILLTVNPSAEAELTGAGRKFPATTEGWRALIRALDDLAPYAKNQTSGYDP